MKKKRFVKSMVSVFTAFVMGITTFATGLPGDMQVVHAETAEVHNQQELTAEDMDTAAEALGLVADSQEEGVYYNSNGSMTDFRDETIYFVMIARFYDGDSSNNVQCWEAQDLNVNDPPWRGDFKGLIDKLDYIKALGFTAIWITPVVENASGYDYHGYHAINFSKVEPRLESNDCTYEDLIEAVHERGMKIIQDVVFNHTGNWGESNLYPIASKDYTKDLSDCEASMVRHEEYGWEDAAKKYGGSYENLIPKNQFNVREDLLMDGTYETKDIYRHNRYIQGWESYQEQITSIAGDCIDLNTENPVVYHYLVDTYSRYIEMGVDAFRVDTVKHISRLTYNKALISQLNEAYNRVHNTTGEGNFYMFGEVCTRVRQVWNKEIPALSCPFYTWKESKEYDWNDSETAEAIATNTASVQQAYEDNNTLGHDPTSKNALLEGNSYHATDYSKASGLNVIDFPMHWNFQHAQDAFRVAVDNDQYYNDATFNVTYVDSHDYAPDGAPENQRFAGTTGDWAENLSLMFTFRGIPCIFYGSEIEFQKGQIIDPGPKMALKETGRAYFGDHIEGSVNTTDFARYSGATGEMAETLNYPLALHIQRLNRLRICIPALRKGQYSTEGCNGGMSFKRRYTDDNTDSFVLVAISSDATFSNVPGGKYVDAITGDEQTVAEGGTLTTSGIKGQGDLRVYVLDTGDKTPFLGMIDGKSQFMSGGTDTVEATSPVQREHGGNEKIPATGITLDKTSATLDLGETVKLTATVTPDNATNKSVTWSTSNNDVAKVSGGTVTAVNEGTATITAKTSNGITADATITVRASGTKVESVTISPKTKTLNAGKTLQLTASVSPAGADPKYAALTWKSSDAGVASVDSNGLVTAKKQGTATITVSTAYFGKSDTAVITVKGPKFTLLDGDAVYFEKPDGWGSEIKAYFWTGSGEWNNAEWPGADMTLLNESAGIYGIKWPEGRTESGMSVIFTDGKGDSTKTADLPAKVNGYYDSSGYVKTVDPNEGGDNPDINSFTADPAGSVYKGNSVNLTADASGGTGSLQYKFTAQSENGSEITVQDYGATGTATWTPQTTGRYTLKVYVKDSDNKIGEGTITNYEVKDNTSTDIQIYFNDPTAKYTYDGTAKRPVIIVKDGTTVLSENTDYTVSYENNVNAGDKADGTGAPAAVITGKGDYAEVIKDKRLTFTIDKAEIPANAPSNAMTVSTGKLSDVAALNGGWSWSDEDKVKDVNAGETITVTAVYNGNDKNNYEKTSVTVNVTGTNCKHDGGTTVKNAVEATCGKAGYTGDTHCSICNAIIESGKVIEATGSHNWNDGALQGGKMIYTCTVCGATTEQPGAVIVRLLDTEFVYDGTPKTPEVTVKSGTTILIKDSDYTVTYRNNTDAGDMNSGDLAPAVIVSCKGSYEGTFKKTFTIKKAAYPKSGKPGSTMNVSKDFEKVSDIKDLPEGWVWDPDDADKTLGEQPIKATAIYNKDDRKNYETVSVEVSITKSSDCSHPFGNVETKNSKSATCTQKGYTGDKYCTNCQTTVQSGTEIPALGHSWSSWKVTKQPAATAKGMKTRQCTRVGCTENEEVQFICDYQYPTAAHVWDGGKVTKQPTATASGEKTYTCNVCSAARKETIPATGGGGSSQTTSEDPKKPTPIGPSPNKEVTITTNKTVKKGTVVTDSASKTTYKVTGTVVKTAEYVVSGSNAKVVTIPDKIVINNSTYKVTSVAGEAFEGNTKITGIVIGKNVKTIGRKAFSGCKNLKEVALSSNVTTIGDNAFYKCTKLTSITIPSKVSKIGKKAFYGCKSLKKITIKTTKLTDKKIGSSAFKGINSKATIKVPKKKLSSYKKILKKKGVGSKVKIKK